MSMTIAQWCTAHHPVMRVAQQVSRLPDGNVRDALAYGTDLLHVMLECQGDDSGLSCLAQVDAFSYANYSGERCPTTMVQKLAQRPYEVVIRYLPSLQVPVTAEDDDKLVYVVSIVTHEGPDTDSGVSSGGFFWFETFEPAARCFQAEVDSYATFDQVSRIRLVALMVPADLTGQDLTDYMDSDVLDEIEVTGEPLRTVDVGGTATH